MPLASDRIPQLNIVVLGLSITSAWGNGHATTWRALTRALSRRGHRVLFLERDVPWYAAHRDMPAPTFVRAELYRDLSELRERFTRTIRGADLVILGSYVPEGVAVGRWVLEEARGVRAFYDIDTPITLAKLAARDHEYIDPELVRAMDLYLSFSGGRALERLESAHGARLARALYCSVEPDLHHPLPTRPPRWELGFLGTWAADRQPALERLLLEPVRLLPVARFVVAGSQYPAGIDWPENVERIEHVAPPEHSAFYGGQRLTLNLTRAEMINLGSSPSVRLFEAASCGVPVISDRWDGLEELFEPGEEILVADGAEDVVQHLERMDDHACRRMGQAARRRVFSAHTARHRASELERYYLEALGASAPRR